MSESPFPTDPNPVTEFLFKPPTKGARLLIILLATGAIITIIALIYNALFPKAYWQSRQLEQYRAKWESQHITHYRMSLDFPVSSNNYDRTPVTVEVRDGKVISVVDALGESLSPGDNQDIDYYYPYFTIPGLFSYTYKEFWQKPPEIEVSYDPALSYPATIYITPFTEPCCMDYTIAVKNFQVLSP